MKNLLLSHSRRKVVEHVVHSDPQPTDTGLAATLASWGGMLSREGRVSMEQAPWLALWPGLCLTITVYSLNMFGDAVRDLLDPRLRGGGGRLAGSGATGGLQSTETRPLANKGPSRSL